MLVTNLRYAALTYIMRSKLLGAPGIATGSDRTLRMGLLALLLGARSY